MVDAVIIADGDAVITAAGVTTIGTAIMAGGIGIIATGVECSAIEIGLTKRRA